MDIFGFLQQLLGVIFGFLESVLGFLGLAPEEEQEMMAV